MTYTGENKMKKNNFARLIIAASEGDSNMLYATRMFVPDPFIFLEIHGKKIVIMSDLEVDRAKSEARVDEVLSFTKLAEKLKGKRRSKSKKSAVTSTDVLDFILKEYDVKNLLVPSNFPLEHADRIRKKGYQIESKSDPFFKERTVKTKEEIEEIKKTQKCTEEAVQEAVKAIQESEIQDSFLYYRGQKLTSEAIKRMINVELMKRDCIASHTIVAPGIQGCDPHNEGSGPLLANQSIIMDVFPHSMSTHYYADMTRTVVRGKASDKLKRMFDAVLEGQEIGFKMIRHGANGEKIHSAIVKRFEKLGFKTGEVDGRMQGFFHGTGHGLGLDVHEPPRISVRKDILKAGQVVTNEPGLYYPDAGGVRIEDLVVVTKTGCENLTKFPKQLEL